MSSKQGHRFYSEALSDGFSIPLRCGAEVFPLAITDDMRRMSIQELIDWLRKQDLLRPLTGGLSGRLYATTVSDGIEEERVLLDNNQTVEHYWGLLQTHNQLRLE